MNRISIVFLAALISGCSGIPYAPKGSTVYDGGYSEKKLDDGKYFVLFEGNAYNNMPQVVDFVKKRASELCSPRELDIEVKQYLRRTTSSGFANGTVYMSNHAFPTAEGVVACK